LSEIYELVQVNFCRLSVKTVVWLYGRNPTWQKAHDGTNDENSSHNADRPSPDQETIGNQQILASRVSTKSKHVLCGKEFPSCLWHSVHRKLFKGV